MQITPAFRASPVDSGGPDRVTELASVGSSRVPSQAALAPEMSATDCKALSPRELEVPNSFDDFGQVPAYHVR